jgi:hypothetical protein
MVIISWQDEQRNVWRFTTVRVNMDRPGKRKLKIALWDVVKDRFK